jgi:hypothetical protein
MNAYYFKVVSRGKKICITGLEYNYLEDIKKNYAFNIFLSKITN